MAILSYFTRFTIKRGNAGSWNSGWKRSKHWKPIPHSSKSPETPWNIFLELIRISGEGNTPGCPHLIVTPWIRCVRCPPVIHRRCLVICLRVAFFHVIICISFCIRVRFMHPCIFPVVCFAIWHSYVPRCPLLPLFCVRVLNFLGMARGLPSGLGIALVDRLSSFVPSIRSISGVAFSLDHPEAIFRKISSF